MKRRQRRKLILLAVLSLLLLAVGLWYWNFVATKSITLDLTSAPDDSIAAPSYLYAFAGSGASRLQQPVGVLADEGTVYVSDSKAGLILQFTEAGRLIRSFGKGRLTTPLYMAKNPKTGNIYVADRRQRKVQIFTPAGRYVGEFDPKLPKSQLPRFDTHGDQWTPVALDFGRDGTLYVVELLNGHRLVIFGPDGRFSRSVGKAGFAETDDASPELFQFPNSVKVHGDEVWISDSNNRRMQVFSLQGDFKRVLPIEGLPRGIAFLPRPSNAPSSTTDKFVVVDTLSNDGTIFGVDGKKLLSFGSRGVLDGEFSYPNDVSVGTKSLLFLTDTNNMRVQVWGWPQKLSPVAAAIPKQPAWCLALLPLLLAPLLFRKKYYFATADFVESMYDAGLVSKMADKKVRWLVLQTDYDVLADRSQDDVLFADLLEPTEYSDSDARALAAKMEIQIEQAAAITAAGRTKLFCTEDLELRRIARLLEMEVVNSAEYTERFQAGKSADEK